MQWRSLKRGIDDLEKYLSRNKIMKLRRIILMTAMVVIGFCANAQVIDSTQVVVDYNNRELYVIKSVEIRGAKYYDKESLIRISGLYEGDEISIPGDQITTAIKNLWERQLFSDVKVSVDKISGRDIYLIIDLKGQPKLRNVNYNGVSRSERDEMKDLVPLLEGGQVTENLISTTKRMVTQVLEAKGYFNATADVLKRDVEGKGNYVDLDINIDKNDKVKIQDINFIGANGIESVKLERKMKKTKAKKILNFFSSKKFIEDEFENDKDLVIAYYNEKGYRDAVIAYDSIIPVEGKDGRVNLNIGVDEGNQYFFGDLKWIGNSIYPTPILSRTLGIKSGDIFNQKLLFDRLHMDDDAVENLYMNSGYLFFNLSEIETGVSKDSINYEFRIYEGDVATINKIIINGNDQTHENVVRRELRTKPGDLFRKDAIIRSVRELANLGHFDPEKIAPNPIPNPADGTVDIEYSLTERNNDQIEVSGGWGADTFVGTLGLKFTNFSARNIFNPDAWSPLPTGDGQTLDIKAQTNGSYYQSYSISFTEPWFGGKKPNSFSFSLFYNKTSQANSDYAYRSDYGGGSSTTTQDQYMKVVGASVGLGYRLKWPDDFFTLYHEISYTKYELKDWTSFLIQNGESHRLQFKTAFGRNSIDNPIFTKSGSKVSTSFAFTMPYSLFEDLQYEDPDLPEEDRYKWIEYWKWNFSGDFFTPLTNKLVLRTKVETGALGYYNRWKPSPFEQFSLGGDGVSGVSYYGSEVIALRGYENNSLTAAGGSNIYTKYQAELRYPLMMGESANIYALAFAEAGNSWNKFRDYNPFNVKRSAGAGVRIFLPMFGLMGFDYGYGFDDANTGNPSDSGGRFHFMMGQSF